MQEASDKWGRKYTWEARRFKGTRWQRKGREGRTDGGEVTNWTLQTVNSITAAFFSKSTVSRENNCIAKQLLWRWEKRMREKGKQKSEKKTLFASWFFASTPQVICQSCLHRGNSSLVDYGSLTDTSLPHRAPSINISPNKVCKHMYKYDNSCTPTHTLSVAY